jgi:DNA-binding HxlR family transcriptional regulator
MLRRRKNKPPPVSAHGVHAAPGRRNLVWRLSGDPRRFSELRSNMHHISAKVLTARLRALDATGVLTRTVVESSPPTVEYVLTALGHEFLPVIEAIFQVGMKLQRMQALSSRGAPGATPPRPAPATCRT